MATGEGDQEGTGNEQPSSIDANLTVLNLDALAIDKLLSKIQRPKLPGESLVDPTDLFETMLLHRWPLRRMTAGVPHIFTGALIATLLWYIAGQPRAVIGYFLLCPAWVGSGGLVGAGILLPFRHARVGAITGAGIQLITLYFLLQRYHG